MEWWFTTMGDDFNGETEKSKKMRVAQLHLACPIHSVAGRFINTLEKTVCNDEELLKAALIDHFHDAEWEDQADEDILTTMSALSQGSQDVFKYSRKVLKLLQRKPKGLQSYDRILIGYYLDGLTSRRLRELAISRSSERDSHETPFQVVKSVMRLATRLKIKGYSNQSSKRSDDENEDEDDDDDDDDDDDNTTYTVGVDSGSDEDSDYYGRSRQKKKACKMATVKKVSWRKDKRAKSKERKNHKGRGNGDEVGGEISQLRERLRDLERMQGAIIPPGNGVVAGRAEEDVVPLDTYAVGQSYGRCPYGRRDTAYPTTYRTEYPNRRSHYNVSRQVDYYHGRREEYPPFQEYGRQETRRMGAPSHSYFDNVTRQLVRGTRFPQGSNPPIGGYSSSGTYENAPGPQPIVGPNGALYYPAGTLFCDYCREEGHLYSQCPALRRPEPVSKRVTLGPDHPASSAKVPTAWPVATRVESVNAVEIAGELSVLDEVKGSKSTTAVVEQPDMNPCVLDVSDLNGSCADSFEWEEEDEMMDKELDYYYPGQVAENPEN